MKSSILIADDTSTILDYLEIIFERQGFDVIKAGHGEAALEAARRSAPDIILLDVMMPGLDGLEVTRRLRADPRTSRIPILLYSAVVGEEIRAQAMAAGVDEFLGKTLKHDELVARVRTWLAARASPGGIGIPALVEVGLDLVLLLESEWVWLLGARDGAVEHLALCSDRGEQRARELLGMLGKGPFPIEGDSLWDIVLGRREWIVNLPVDELAEIPAGGPIQAAARHAGSLGVTILPLDEPGGGQGVLIFSPAPTVGQSGSIAQAVGVATRYAAAAIHVWNPADPAKGPST